MTLEIWGDYGAGPQVTLNVEQTGDGLVFSNDSGQAVHEVKINEPGLDPRSVLAAALGTYPPPTVRVISMALVDSDDRAESVTPPWGGMNASGTSYIQTSGNELFAHVVHRPLEEPGLVTFRSSDGFSWSGPSVPDIGQGEADFLSVAIAGGVAVAEIYGAETNVWVSDDGNTWTDTGLTWGATDPLFGDGELAPPTVVRAEVGAGGIYYDDRGGVWASPDFTSFEKVELGTQRIWREMAGGGRPMHLFAAGDAIFFVQSEDELSTREMWVWTKQA
jgi:hypothetical protein